MVRAWAVAAAMCLIGAGAVAQERSSAPERFCDAPPCFTEFDAYFSAPTTRYAHGVLGDAVEWGALYLLGEAGGGKIILPDARVFEDLAPRLVDVDGDAVPEVVVIESHENLGAALVIYKLDGTALKKHAATPHIGRSYRWLAPAGIADFDGNGTLDFAYIDRPHLAKTLRIWSYQAGALTEIAGIRGLTNHKIGEDFISGGLRNCDGQPQIVTADAAWDRVIATFYRDGQWVSGVLSDGADRAAFARAMAC